MGNLDTLMNQKLDTCAPFLTFSFFKKSFITPRKGLKCRRQCPKVIS